MVGGEGWVQRGGGGTGGRTGAVGDLAVFITRRGGAQARRGSTEQAPDVGHGQAPVIQRPAVACMCVATPRCGYGLSRPLCHRDLPAVSKTVLLCCARLAAALAEQRELPSSTLSAMPTPVGVGTKTVLVANSSAQQSGLVRSQRTIPRPQTAPPQRAQSHAPQVIADDKQAESPDEEAGDDDEVGPRRGRSTLTEEERRERRCAPHIPQYLSSLDVSREAVR